MAAHSEDGMILSQEDVYLTNYIRHYPPGHFNIEPYDIFIRGISDAVSNTVLDLKNGHLLVFSNVRAWKPTRISHNKREVMYPQYARERGDTYASEVIAKASIVNIGADGKTTVTSEEDFIVGLIPTMIQSELCNLKGLSAQELAAVGEDPDDIRGYFVVDGKEYCVLLQEQLVLNRIFLMKHSPKDGPTVRMTVVSPEKATSICVVAIDKKGVTLRYRFQSLGKYKSVGNNKVASYRGVNFVYIFAALGITDWQTIIHNVLAFIPEKEQKNCLITLSSSFKNYIELGDPATAAIRVFRKKFSPSGKIDDKLTDADVQKLIQQTLQNDFFVHCNSMAVPEKEGETREQYEERHIRIIYQTKLNLLCIMVAEMTRYLTGYRAVDDPDSWSNKCTKSAGNMMSGLFRTAWKRVVKELSEQIVSYEGRSITEVSHFRQKLNNPVITNSFRDSFVTGGWGVKGSNIKNNIAQLLMRETKTATVSHISTVDVSVSREGGHQMRVVQHSQYGFIDPIATPEGNNAGLVKNISCTVKFSPESREDILSLIILGGSVFPSLVKENPEPAEGYTYPLLLNGKFYGWCKGKEVVTHLVSLKRQGQIDSCCTIILVNGYVFVDNSPSRVMRPLFILDEDGIPLVEKKGLMNASPAEWLQYSVIEYVSPLEQEWIDVAPTKDYIQKRKALVAELENNIRDETAKAENADKELIGKWTRKLEKITPYTHLEISPLALVSCTSACIPWPNHNQAPRNTYQFGMSKQALNSSAVRSIRYTTAKTKTLMNSQSPLVSSPMFDALDLKKSGTGENIYVAFAALPFTEEDSFIMKKEFLERGGFLNMREFTVSAVIKSTDTPQEVLCVPMMENDSPEKYSHLYNNNADENGVIHDRLNGLPIEGALVEDGDCIIGKMQFLDQTKINTSVYLKYGEHGIVSKVIVHRDPNSGTKQIIIKIRSIRIPTHGDKFAARNAQKGTIGYVIPERFLPFDERGISPDFITNPHCIPSRMTISYLFEILASTAAAFTGKVVNGEAFAPTNYMKNSEIIASRGFDGFCNNTMFSGCSGKPLHAKIFSGICHEQELKYQAVDKEQYRDDGKYTDDGTRQPIKGRARHGGLRFGEMERDAIISHGASRTVKERLMDVSDPYPAAFCENCGAFAINSKITDGFIPCNRCGNSTNYCKKTVPYAWKYLHDLLMTMGISLTPVFEKSNDIRKKILQTGQELIEEEEEHEEEEAAEEGEFVDEFE